MAKRNPRIDALAPPLAVLLMLACRPVDPYLAPGLVLPEASYPERTTLPKPISPREALRAAVGALERRGVRNVRICHLDWIVAPLGAAIFQATGRWDTPAGRFDAFVVSIHDGTEAQYGSLGGAENYVVGRGVGNAGMEIFYDSARVSGPQFFRFEEVGEETEREAMFEFVSRETLRQLPSTCGVRQ